MKIKPLSDNEITSTEAPCETCKLGEKEISQSEADKACNICFYRLVARAAQADALRQVIIAVQSALTELEGEIK